MDRTLAYLIGKISTVIMISVRTIVIKILSNICNVNFQVNLKLTKPIITKDFIKIRLLIFSVKKNFVSKCNLEYFFLDECKLGHFPRYVLFYFWLLFKTILLKLVCCFLIEIVSCRSYTNQICVSLDVYRVCHTKTA